jgi:hypothetical protein
LISRFLIFILFLPILTYATEWSKDTELSTKAQSAGTKVSNDYIEQIKEITKVNNKLIEYNSKKTLNNTIKMDTSLNLEKAISTETLKLSSLLESMTK